MSLRGERTDAGFSLLEALVSLAIVAGLAASLLPFSRSLLDTWQRAPAQVDEIDGLMRGIQLISEDLGQRLPVSQDQGNGGSDIMVQPTCLRLVRRALMGSLPSLRLVTYHLEPEASATILMRREDELRTAEQILRPSRDDVIFRMPWMMAFTQEGASPTSNTASPGRLPRETLLRLTFRSRAGQGTAPEPLRWRLQPRVAFQSADAAPPRAVAPAAPRC